MMEHDSETNAKNDNKDFDPVSAKRKIDEALAILRDIGLPESQQNERSALTLLALLDLKPNNQWSEASNPALRIFDIMKFISDFYGRKYAPNTRETIRRFTVHQFLQAGLLIENPDNPSRPVNSPHYKYQIEPNLLNLLRTYGTAEWELNLRSYLSVNEKLKSYYREKREMQLIPLKTSNIMIKLSPGGQNELIKKIIEEFCPRFTPEGVVVYIGDAKKKKAYFNETLLKKLGVTVDEHGKMPDVVVYFEEKNWLVLIEAVTSHGPIDFKRQIELKNIFKTSTAGLVLVTAFLDRKSMAKYLNQIAWETEVWIAEAPDHLIHFNGERFLGPY
jgi:hypothetical protein